MGRDERDFLLIPCIKITPEDYEKNLLKDLLLLGYDEEMMSDEYIPGNDYLVLNGGQGNTRSPEFDQTYNNIGHLDFVGNDKINTHYCRDYIEYFDLRYFIQCAAVLMGKNIYSPTLSTLQHGMKIKLRNNTEYVVGVEHYIPEYSDKLEKRVIFFPESNRGRFENYNELLEHNEIRGLDITQVYCPRDGNSFSRSLHSMNDLLKNWKLIWDRDYEEV